MRPRSEFVSIARNARRNHQYKKSGEYYSLAYYAYLTAAWDERRTHDLGYLRMGSLLQPFVWAEYAATCYKVANGGRRSVNRVKQGLLALDDIRENVIDHEAWVGLSWELEADLRQIAELSEVEAAYTTAMKNYRVVESNSNDSEILSWTSEPGFNEASLFVVALVEGVGENIDITNLRTENNQPSLAKRLEFKQDNLARLLEQLMNQGKWQWMDHQFPSIDDDRSLDDPHESNDYQ